MQLTQEKQELIQKNLRYLQLLSQEYPTIAVAASEVINQEAVLRLPKGTEHFMSDLHGENEAFRHVLNSASGVIREKVDAVLAQENATPEECQEFATLIYYPEQKLPLLKAAQGEENLDYGYEHTLLRLIELCRLVSSKHTRARVRRCLPNECAHILDELLHAHFEDHNKEMYYDEIIISMIENGQADNFIIHFCKLIKRLAVDKLHIVGDLYDRGPRPDESPQCGYSVGQPRHGVDGRSGRQPHLHCHRAENCAFVCQCGNAGGGLRPEPAPFGPVCR